MRKKTLFYVLIFCLTISSLGCTKDDSSTSDLGLIIGVWEGYSRTVVFVDGTSEDLPSVNCEGHILFFYEDGRVHWVDFIRGTEDSCIENTETKPIGNWERISNGKYIITLFNALDDSEIHITPELITFNNNGAETMDIRYQVLPENVPENASFYYLTLFKR